MFFLGQIMWPSRRKVEKFLKIALPCFVVTIVTLDILLRNGGIKAPAVYLRAVGGLGNQLFMFGCAYSLARTNNWPLYVYLPPTNQSRFGPDDREFALDHFNIPLTSNNTDSDGTLVNRYTVVELTDFSILSRTYPKDRVLHVDEHSYCQSEAFFLPYKDEILKMFVQNIETQPIQSWIEMIKSQEDTVAVHVRRGDLMSLDHRVIHISYYAESMIKIAMMLNRKPAFFIFSDDVDYVKRKLNFLDYELPWGPPEIHFVSSPNTTSLQEFYLMSICNHFIIPASTFGWWAAYRSPNPKKIVIAAHYHPDYFRGAYDNLQWRNMYYPPSWITVDPLYEDIHSTSRRFYSLPISLPGYLLYFLFACLCSLLLSCVCHKSGLSKMIFNRNIDNFDGLN